MRDREALRGIFDPELGQHAGPFAAVQLSQENVDKVAPVLQLRSPEPSRGPVVVARLARWR